jgi:hypothetical protein
MDHPSTHRQSGSIGQWVWLLPAAYSAHVAEEAFGGKGLTKWMAAGGGARLSIAEFIGLNLIGVAALLLAVWAARRWMVWRWTLISGAVILLVNGVCHVAACVVARTYVPGLWTGILLYLPVGGLLLFRLWRSVSPRPLAAAIAVGFVIHGVVVWLVLRMPGFTWR